MAYQFSVCASPVVIWLAEKELGGFPPTHRVHYQEHRGCNINNWEIQPSHPQTLYRPILNLYKLCTCHAKFQSKNKNSSSLSGSLAPNATRGSALTYFFFGGGDFISCHPGHSVITARHYASAVYAETVCPSVNSQVGVLSTRLNGSSSFWERDYHRLILRSFGRELWCL